MANATRPVLPQSRRMRLCEVGYEDIPKLSSLFAQTRMYPLLLDSPTRFIDVAAIVACVQRLYASSHGLGAWQAEAPDGAFIGLFSLLPIEGTADVEIHVRLKPEAWGRWYAIEGTRLLCQRAFEVVGLPRLFGYCHPDHQRVRRIMSYFGFRDLGLCEHRRQMAHCYELDAETWRERGATLAH
ncbi:GNAT family N-acetyltransferase [Dyella choica]|nr:GNAT family N-acetyltransferase [Dyella choica]